MNLFQRRRNSVADGAAAVAFSIPEFTGETAMAALVIVIVKMNKFRFGAF
jgi:hypothetical protein